MPVTRVQVLSLVPLHHQEPVALDGDIERIRADFNRPLVEVGRDTTDLHPQTDLPRVGAAQVAAGSGTDRLRLQKLRGEDDARLLEADGVRVGDIVAHHVDHGFRGLHAGERGGGSGKQAHKNRSCYLASAERSLRKMV